LASWRPGRYELGNFAKNIKKFEAFDMSGNPLPFSKKAKDLWVVKSGGASMVKVTYSYFASEINAGSTYVDGKQMYVNPCNCCMYLPARMNEEHVIELDVPENFTVATSLKKNGERELHANHFHELADSPFIASADIKTISFTAAKLPVHIHIQGECIPDKEKLIHDFRLFAERQLEFFGGAPIDEYHFLFQVLDHKFYHGVEHLNSTVIAIGPGYHFMHGKTYEDVLGVSCHEMFHLWNIKTIRPAEMLPYNYTKENYARTGYVYEGFTTYYGDLLLLQCKIFSQAQYFATLEERLNKHFHNWGRFNLSLAESSWDNWLDGYVPGAPYRKVSIYDEGNLVAFMLDVLIMKNTSNKKSLENVLKNLYADVGRSGVGYTEEDIIRTVNHVAGKDLTEIFTKYVYGLEGYEIELQHCFNYLGLEMEKHYSAHYYETHLGFKVTDVAHTKKISLIAPGSPAWKAGLALNDEIIGINNKHIKNDLNEWLLYFTEKGEKLSVNVVRGIEMMEINIEVLNEKRFFPHYKIVKELRENTEKASNYAVWSKC
ncbi:MAG: PDZ domain-containing protein, partial [Bacteroidia bacterium]|nr:PDZ domain-containing protein [Bacteroidia bacterium]